MNDDYDYDNANTTDESADYNYLRENIYNEFNGLRLPFGLFFNSSAKWLYASNALPKRYELTDDFLANTIIQVVLSFVSILLNSLVIIVSLKASRKNSVDVALSLYTRVSLSFADVLAATATLMSVLLLSFYHRRHMHDKIWDFVAVLILLQTFFTTTSFCHLILMSIRRYVLISRFCTP